ncbi:MAG: hypothetical protein ACFFCQ_09915 [Promethearchaeota archaeon]
MNSSKVKPTRLNFELDEEYSTLFMELQAYHGINKNVDMIKNMIKVAHRAMLKEKKELGLKD